MNAMTNGPSGYKQTEVGVIPEDWDVGPLMDIADIDSDNLGGDTPANYAFNYISLEDVDVGSLRSYSEQNFSSAPSRARRRLKSGDILVSTVRPNLQSHLLFTTAQSNWVCSTGFSVLRCKSQNAVSGYVFFHLFGHHVTKQIEALLTGSNYPAINGKDVKALKIPLPPVNEQRAIATALSDVDALLAAQDKLIAKKRDIKQAAMQQLLTGKQRLPGFSGEWEVKSFSSALFKVNAKEHQIQTSEYQDTGTFPVVDQGKQLVIGYSDRGEKCFKCPDDGVIVFGDHTCITKFVDFDFIVGADGTQILKTQEGQCARFHAYQLERSGIQTTGYNRHFKYLKEKEFVASPLQEQIAIAAVLSDMDAEISTLEKQRDKTRAIKQGMMQELLTGRIRLV